MGSFRASCWNGLLALHGDWDVDACWKVAETYDMRLDACWKMAKPAVIVAGQAGWFRCTRIRGSKLPCGDVWSQTRTPRTNLPWFDRGLYCPLQRFAATDGSKNPRRAMEGSSGDARVTLPQTQTRALRTSYFRTTEPNKICRFRCTSQGSATS